MYTNRRDLLLAGCCAGSTSLFWSVAARLRAEGPSPPPETTTIRLARLPGICIAPQYVVSDLLNAEGFTNVVYVQSNTGGVEVTNAVANGDIDFTLNFSGPLLLDVDRGLNITLLAGIHVGCFELFAKKGIRSVADLKGRTVGIQALGTSPHIFISAMATLVGLDPAKDIEWVTSASVKPTELFAEGKIDAFLGFPPEPQRLRAQNTGHVSAAASLSNATTEVRDRFRMKRYGPLTLPRVKRISGSKNFRSPSQEDFCNNIGPKRPRIGHNVRCC